MTRWWCIIALATGCWRDAPAVGTPPPPIPPAAISPRAYELGQGVPRDYRRAAALYAERCGDGCGDLAACRGLLELARASRGFAPRIEQVAVLVRMCDRGDALGCMVGSLLGVVDDRGAPAPDLGGRCARGDAGACDAAVLDARFAEAVAPERFPREEDIVAGLRARMIGATSRLCQSGMAKACVQMVWTETFLCRDLVDKNPDCVAQVIADRRRLEIDPAPFVLAWTRVQAACTDGNADACALVPGHEVSDRALCDAGDFRSCAKLGEQGDAQARRFACAGGIGTSCTPPRPGATTSQIVDAVDALHRRCKAADADACAQLATLRAPPACAAPR